MTQVSPTRITASPPALPPRPADELLAVLQGLRRRLVAVTGPARAAAARTERAPQDLDDLSDYLVNELNPVLHALALRVYPPLRQLGVAGPDPHAATEQARLLRLTERLTMIRADQTPASDVDDLVQEITTLAGNLLHRVLHTMPGLLDGLGDREAARIVDAAQRTIRAGHHLPHLELQPALL